MAPLLTQVRPSKKTGTVACGADTRVRASGSYLVPSIFGFDQFVLFAYIINSIDTLALYEPNMYEGQMGLNPGSSPYQLFDLNRLLNFSLPYLLFVMEAMTVPAS